MIRIMMHLLCASIIFLLSAVAQGVGFPRVYTVILRNDDLSLASQVDLLRTTSTHPNATKISFLVQSEYELKGLPPLSFPLKVDEEQSRFFQMKNATNATSLRRQLSTYSTIAGFPCYKSLEGSLEWMKQMTELDIPTLDITMSDIGDSYLKTVNPREGHDIWVLKVTGTTTTTSPTENKGIMMVIAGIHPRELTPPELVSRWMDHLISSYGIDADATSILDHTEIHIVLQANPDGRQLVETRPTQINRRKNFRRTSGSCSATSIGVDLNRNFPFNWGDDRGSSSYPCSPVYRGSAPASEPEIQALVDYASSIFPTEQRVPGGADIDHVYDNISTKGVFVDVHSYGEFMVYPWGFINRPSGNDLELRAWMNKFRYYNSYEATGPNNGFYSPASGASDDWAFGTLGTPSMTLELGTSFRESCVYFENSIEEKNRRALTYAAKTSPAPLHLPKGPDVTSLTVNSLMENGDENLVQVNADASDFLLAYDKSFTTTRQTVAKVEVFTIYPDNDAQGGVAMTQDSSGSFTLSLDVSEFDLSIQNMIYAKATDTDGYAGPLTAAFLPIKKDDPTRQPTRQPAPQPAPQPTLSPTQSTIPTPSPTTQSTLPPIPVNACFSGHNRVQLSDGSYTEMSALRIGDAVRVHSNSHYEHIYSFGHYAPQAMGEFLSINHGVLELSPSHLVLTTHEHWIPAEKIKIGDNLITINNIVQQKTNNTLRVHSIDIVFRRGVYAPFTASGTIVVNDIVASTFISLQPNEENLHIGWDTGLSFQWLSLTFESGHRLYGHFFGFDKRESYNKDGISQWVEIPFKIMVWTSHQPAIAMIIIIFPLLVLCILLSLVEQAILLYYDSSSSEVVFIVMITILLVHLAFGKDGNKLLGARYNSMWSQTRYQSAR